MKNLKKIKLPFSIFTRTGNHAEDTFIFLATVSLIGGILVFIKWIWVSDSHIAWTHAKHWWYLLIVFYAISSLFQKLNRISDQLQDINEELTKQKNSNNRSPEKK